jgi:hypothetical protein
MNCTREHRMVEVICYVVQPDGTVWAMYEPCSHGISEAAALYYPRLEMQISPVQGETAQELSR